MENNNILEYKNQSIFYDNLYNRLFNLIDLLIDESTFNIILLKNTVIDFFDSYSYYLMKQELISRDDVKLEEKDILKQLKQFDKFTSNLSEYPSTEFIRARLILIKHNNDLNKLSPEDYYLILREYYSFFNIVLNMLKGFVDVCSISGFLPNVKSKTSHKSIGYANFNEFFKRLETLKLKLSDLTSNIKLNNLFKSRRCAFSILVVFSPYFQKLKVYDILMLKLDFKFISDDETLDNLRQSSNYELDKLPLDLKEIIDKNILNDLRESISLIKRYISYELGERDISPKIKKKYGYDPTGV